MFFLKEFRSDIKMHFFLTVPADTILVQQPILVCTAHIHWDPEFCDVKLIQTMMLSQELRAILDEAAQTLKSSENINADANNIQLVLCGDFNSLPDSGVTEFLSSGRVSLDHKDFKDLSYKQCLEKISGCDKSNEFTHSFKLASAYSEDIMPYTNYTYVLITHWAKENSFKSILFSIPDLILKE